MSSRLVTTPWFTKNLAGGWLDTGLLLRGTREGTGRARMVPQGRRAAWSAAGTRRRV